MQLCLIFAKIEKQKMLIPTTVVLDKELVNVFLQFGMRFYIHWMYRVAFSYAHGDVQLFNDRFLRDFTFPQRAVSLLYTLHIHARKHNGKITQMATRA